MLDSRDCKDLYLARSRSKKVMSEQIPQPQNAPVAEARATVPSGVVGRAVGWRHVWQIPVLAVGIGAIAWAGWYAAKTTPRIDRGGGLTEASGQIEKGEYEGALGTLNEKVLPYLSKAELTPDQEREFYLLRARAVFLGQRDLGFSRQANNENILKEYERASQLGATLTSRDLAYQVHTLIDLGNFDAALQKLETMPPGDEVDAAVQRELRKRLIDAALAGGPARADAALTLLAELTDERGVSDRDRLWALERQSKVLLQQGLAEDAVTRILRAMPRLEDAGELGSAVGAVLVTLAEAYLQLGQVQRAGEQLLRAEKLLGEADVLSPRVGRLLGRVDQEVGGERLTYAKDRYTRVLEAWGTSEEVPRTLLGLAEVESGLSNLESAGLLRESQLHYGQLVDLLLGQASGPGNNAEHAVGTGAEVAHEGGATEAGHGTSKGEKITEPGRGGTVAKPDGHANASEPEGAKTKNVSSAHGEEPSGGHVDSHEGSSAGDHAPKTVDEAGRGVGFKIIDEGLLKRETLASLMSRFVEQFDKADHVQALAFASIAKRLSGIDEAPPELLLGLARTHRELAGELLRVPASGAGDHRGIEAGEPGGESSQALRDEAPEERRSGERTGAEILRLSGLDPATQREAREHLLRAGEYYRTHAARVVQTDARAYGDSLWNAADMFDRAGDLASSALAFEQFAADFPGDSRKPLAQFRLAEAQRARGDVELAAKIYQELIASRGERDAGPLADASFVPLAATLLLDSKPENDAQAEELLLRVTRGEVGGTGTGHFKEALRTLGELYYDTGRYERAIERLSEYLTRERDGRFSLSGGGAGSGQTGGTLAANQVAEVSAGFDESREDSQGGDAVGLLYKLADSHRLSAVAIAAGFGVAMPDTQRRELEQARRERLVTGGALFERVSRAYERLPRRTGLDELRMRNAAFYRADCAFDLRDFEAAIRLYDGAKERYPRDPASLVAMVQIVAALIEQGKTAEASTANTRARRFYESLPQTAWDDPTLPMNRKQWEQWLDVQTKLSGGVPPEAADSAGGTEQAAVKDAGG